MGMFRELPSTWKWRIKRAGFTQADFARQVGLSSAGLNLAMNEKTEARLKTVDKIETLLRKIEEENGWKI